jgi:hypothetical protein
VISRAYKATIAAIELDDVVLGIGLLLVAVGLWQCWRPGAYLVPGAVVVWIALPTRGRFIAAVEKSKSKARPD